MQSQRRQNKGNLQGMACNQKPEALRGAVAGIARVKGTVCVIAEAESKVNRKSSLELQPFSEGRTSLRRIKGFLLAVGLTKRRRILYLSDLAKAAF